MTESTKFYDFWNLKIGHYLVKIWTKICGLFFGQPCTYAVIARYFNVVADWPVYIRNV